MKLKRTKKKKRILKFREAFKTFLTLKLAYRIDSGEYDHMINDFLEGNSIKLKYMVELVSNDIIFMNVLVDAEDGLSESTIKKVKKMWDKEKKK